MLGLKGTGARDLIWLKVVSLDRSGLVGLMDDLKKILKVLLYILNNFFLKFSGRYWQKSCLLQM